MSRCFDSTRIRSSFQADFEGMRETMFVAWNAHLSSSDGTACASSDANERSFVSDPTRTSRVCSLPEGEGGNRGPPPPTNTGTLQKQKPRRGSRERERGMDVTWYGSDRERTKGESFLIKRTSLGFTYPNGSFPESEILRRDSIARPTRRRPKHGTRAFPTFLTS